MKKILCLLLAITLMTGAAVAVYADGPGKTGNGPDVQDGTETGMPFNGMEPDNNAQENGMPFMQGIEGQGINPPQQGMPEQNGFGNNQMPGMNNENGMQQGMNGFQQGMNGMQQGMPGEMNGSYTSASSPTAIVTSDVTNTAKSLVADKANAITYTMSEENNEVKIDEAGTYIVTGSCSDGNIIVKKNTTGVVLILKDLDLTSTSGAAVSLNKYSEVKVVIEGTVKLTDNENPALEDVDDDYDGAALKAKDGSNVYLTGSGTLIINGNAKNGIKVGDEDTPSFVIDGSLSINITATNDGINAGYDLTILSGTISISAGDDGIHADRILTIGNDGNGPSINISKSYEALEASVVNLLGGKGELKASDDGVNAANSDNTYASSLTYSINITGGEWNISCSGDGLDSNGNINITGGHTTIRSGSQGGEAGLDYTGTLYVADGTLDNYSGVAFDAGMGQQGMMQGAFGDMQSGNQNGMMPFQQDNGFSQNGMMPGEMQQSQQQGGRH
ncbi:MAG: carbohydrate-binding domain-containing protein [Erysipelotrichaceae bacterium]|nr:carbohydrate-binding domain-containing protein [Erysipelotrichaceae bacterium]